MSVTALVRSFRKDKIRDIFQELWSLMQIFCDTFWRTDRSEISHYFWNLLTHFFSEDKNGTSNTHLVIWAYLESSPIRNRSEKILQFLENTWKYSVLVENVLQNQCNKNYHFNSKAQVQEIPGLPRTIFENCIISNPDVAGLLQPCWFFIYSSSISVVIFVTITFVIMNLQRYVAERVCICVCVCFCVCGGERRRKERRGSLPKKSPNSRKLELIENCNSSELSLNVRLW